MHSQFATIEFKLGSFDLRLKLMEDKSYGGPPGGSGNGTGGNGMQDNRSAMSPCHCAHLDNINDFVNAGFLEIGERFNKLESNQGAPHQCSGAVPKGAFEKGCHCRHVDEFGDWMPRIDAAIAQLNLRAWPTAAVLALHRRAQHGRVPTR